MDKKEQNLQEDYNSLNKLSMNILIHAGNARDELVKGLDAIENQEYSDADALFKKSKKEIVIAHGLQTDTLQMEANGQNIRYSPLFCHAQDTLMTAQSELLISEHLLKIISKLCIVKED